MSLSLRSLALAGLCLAFGSTHADPQGEFTGSVFVNAALLGSPPASVTVGDIEFRGTWPKLGRFSARGTSRLGATTGPCAPPGPQTVSIRLPLENLQLVFTAESGEQVWGVLADGYDSGLCTELFTGQLPPRSTTAEASATLYLMGGTGRLASLAGNVVQLEYSLEFIWNDTKGVSLGAAITSGAIID